MKIKITRGVYGFLGPSGFIIPKDKNSLPFELDDTKAARLLALNVAEVVEDTPTEKQKNEPAATLPDSVKTEKKTGTRGRKKVKNES